MNIDVSPVPAKPNGPAIVKIIRHVQVCQKLCISPASLFDMVAKGDFPKPFPIIPGGRSVGWLEAEVDAWIMQRAQEVGQ